MFIKSSSYFFRFRFTSNFFIISSISSDFLQIYVYLKIHQFFYFIIFSSYLYSLKILSDFLHISSDFLHTYDYFRFHLIFFKLCLSQILSYFLKIYIHFKFPHIFLLIHKCSSDLCSLPISLNFIQISSDFYIFMFTSIFIRFLFRQIFFWFIFNSNFKIGRASCRERV